MNELLSLLNKNQIRLYLEDSKLKCSANKGKVTSEILQQIKIHKAALTSLLSHKTKTFSHIPTTPTLPDYPLSFAEERLWFLNQLDGNNATYNIPIAYKIKGAIHIPYFQQSLDFLIKKHESLRTVFFKNSEGEGRQKIIENLSYPLDYKHVKKSDLDKLINQQATTIFDLKTAPLCQFHLWEYAENEYLFFIVHHHIISDGISVMIMIKELFNVYQDILTSFPDCRKQNQTRYVDFLMWQREELNSESLNNKKQYWIKKIQDYQTLNLPLDYQRPSTFTSKGTTLAFNLDEQLATQIKNIISQKNTTGYNFFLAVFNLLLSKYSGQNDIIIGTPVANRYHVELENIIGLFANTLVLRNIINKNDSFEIFLQSVTQTTIEALEHQEIPFDYLVDALKISRDPARNPIFQVMYSAQETKHNTDIEINNNIVISPYDVKFTESAKFDLSLSVTIEPHDIKLEFEYCTDLFSYETIQLMQERFIYLLKEVIDKTNAPIMSLSMLSKSEFQRLVKAESIVHVENEKSIISLFTEQVKNYPNKLAVEFQGEEITYKELDIRSTILAQNIVATFERHHQDSFQPDQMIAISLERGLELAIGLLAILKLGAAYVPIDPFLPIERINYILEDTNCKILLTQNKLTHLYNSEEYTTICIDDINYSQNINSFNLNIKPSSLAYVIYTSGTTGKPKGVLIEHRSLTNLVLYYKTALGISINDRFSSLASFSFDAFGCEIWPCLCSGASLFIANKKTILNVSVLQRWIIDRKITICDMTTVLAEILFTIDWPKNHCLKLLKIGGEKAKLLPPVDLGFDIINTYGPTEACIEVTHATIFKNGKQLFSNDNIPIGHAISNVNLYILDQYMQPCPIGIHGELYIGGISLARGYLNQPTLTQQSFLSDPFQYHNLNKRMYKTGDIVKRRKDGLIEYIERSDQQVKINGHRIELNEIEKVLLNHHNIKQAIVQINKGNAINYLIAYVVVEHGLNERTIIQYLKSKLPDYMIPSVFIPVIYFPLNNSGKIDVRALPKPSILAEQSNYIPPTTATEIEFCKIWSDLLKQENIGLVDDFFRLGGNSILAIRASHLMTQFIKREITVGQIFHHKNIRNIVDNLKLFEIENAITPQGLTSYPLSSAQESLWYLERVNKDQSAYHVPMLFQLPLNMNLDALEKTLLSIVKRHQILRTTFNRDSDGADIQVVNEPVFKCQKMAIKLNDWEDCLEKYCTQTFDLLREGPIRAVILHCNNKNYILVNIHHIAFDGWSSQILIHELNQFYLHYSEGRELYLPPLSIQYKDYSLWQQNQLQLDSFSQHLNYWCNNLNNFSLLDLPIDKQRPAQFDYQGDDFFFTLSPEMSLGVDKLAKELNMSNYTILLSVFYLLLSDYANQDDVIIGIPVSNRRQKQIASLIGYFVNSLVLRQKIDLTATIHSFLLDVQQTFINAQLHEIVPFEKVVTALKPPKDDSRHSIFQVMFDYVEESTELNSEINLFEPISIYQAYRTAKFDLTLSFEKNNNIISGNFNYATSLFNLGTIKRFSEHFKFLLYQVINNTQQEIQNLTLINEDDKKKIAEYNKTKNCYPQESCFQQLFSKIVNQEPSQLAVIDEQNEITYQQLDVASNQFAHYILSYIENNQIENESKIIAISCVKNINFIIALLGIIKAGYAFLPIDPNTPLERINYILKNANVTCFIIDERMPPQSFLYCIHMDESDYYVCSTLSLNMINQCNDLLYVIYTSGTTGQPKGVMIEHRSLINFIYHQRQVFMLNSEDKIALIHSIAFDAAIEQIGLALLSGVGLVLCPQELLANEYLLHSYLINKQVTHLDMTPSFLTAYNIEKVTTLKTVITGAEACDNALVKRFLDRKINLYNEYGPTETTIVATQFKFIDNSTTSIGRPISNTTCYVLDKNMRLKPLGAVGELYIGGDCLARGYFNNAEFTNKAFIFHDFDGKGNVRLYKTGDLVKWNHHGNLEYFGRIDKQVKLRGFRIELNEILYQLKSIDIINNACVVLENNDRLVAYVELRGDIHENTALKKIKENLTQKLPHYMLPSIFVLMDTIPLTQNGKIDLHRLPKSTITENKKIIAMSPNEFRLRTIWQELLNISEPLGVNVNFYEYGGNSLLAIRCLGKINSQYNINLSLNDVMENFTIQYIATLIDQNTNAKWTPLVNMTKSNNSQPVIYFLPGIIGCCAAYANVANELSDEFCFKLLEAKGLDGKEEPHTNLDDLISCYSDAIENDLKSTSCFLVGHSFGCNIAFDIACRLEKKNIAINLVLIDGAFDQVGSLKEAIGEENTDQALLIAFETIFNIEINESDALDPLKTIGNSLFPDSDISINYKNQIARGFSKVFEAQAKMTLNCQPSDCYDGKINYLYSVKSDTIEKSIDTFQAVSKQKIVKYPVKGEHLEMLDRQHAGDLALQIKRALTNIIVDKL